MDIALLSALALSFTLVWFRPHLVLGVILFWIPFGHLVRFDIGGIPFSFLEVAVYVLAGVLAARTFFSSFRGYAEESHTTAPPNNGARSLGSGLGMTTWWRNPWIFLPILWMLVAAIAAIGSPAGMRAWGIWKAYATAPVVLFWIIRYLVRDCRYVGERLQMTNDEFLISNQSPSPNDQISKSKTAYLLPPTPYLLLPLALGAFLVAALAIIQRWFPIGVPYPWSQPGQFRATSVFGYPNAVGLYLAPLVPLLLLWSLRGRNRSNPGHGEAEIALPRAARLAMTVGFAAVAFLSLLAIIFAKSTGALVALAVALPFLAILFWRQRGKRTGGAEGGSPAARRSSSSTVGVRSDRTRLRAGVYAASVIIVWIATSIAITAWLPYQRDLERIRNPVVRKLAFGAWSGSVRLEQYRETWSLLRDHPIRGAGLAAYQMAIVPYHRNSRVEIFLYPHNLLLAVWVELGLVG
ncbi:O-antigen ligase family protein, partial [Candidatus Uhrbacteria bacterium]|nr:O-antigen ligase family protein [Candidatus Uhrbacteria bacterium]